jgi:hypothetical protein
MDSKHKERTVNKDLLEILTFIAEQPEPKQTSKKICKKSFHT